MKVVSPGIRTMEVRNVSFFCCILFSTCLTLHICHSKISADDLWLPKVVAFITYGVFKSHINFTEGLELFLDERIRVGKEEAGTRTFNQSYGKFQAKQDKAQKRKLLELAKRKVN